MAVYHDARCRLCRREGMKLFLKGERCYSEKCAIEKRNFVPGQHGKNKKMKKTVGYGLQLREKQKARRRVLEEFERRYVQAALEKQKGRGTPDWLELETDQYKGRVLQTPSRESIQIPVNEQLIVELYSK